MNRAEKRRRNKQAAKAAQSAGGQALQSLLNAGLQHHRAGNLTMAERHYREVLKTAPRNPQALNLLGVIAHQSGHNAAAAEFLRKAVAAQPGFTDAHYNLALALQGLGQLEDAATHYGKAVALQADHAAALSNLGQVLGELGRFEDALAVCERAVAAAPTLAPAHNNLGNALQDLDRLDEAAESFRNAIARDPKFAAAHFNLSNALRDLGQLDDARAACRMAIALQPRYAKAHRMLALMCRYQDGDEHLAQMESLLDADDLDDDARMHLAFALGKAYEDLGRHDEAFANFEQGNALKRATFAYSVAETDAYFADLKAVFDAHLFAHTEGTGTEGATPIFIVGMPRSGTTLVEQILSSHPEVFGAGELTILRQIAMKDFATAKSAFPRALAEHLETKPNTAIDALKNGAERYLAMVHTLNADARFITDKMPNNFELVGLVKLMLPHAKIIHCRRDPMDTCLSIYKNYFSGTGNDYAYDLDELGHYYAHYRDLMAHWHVVLPGFIHDVHYEDLVADPETSTRAMLDFCGLAWNDACLDFHTNVRPVRTTSATQVRAPLYADSVARWKNFERHLRPIAERLL